MLFIFLKSLKKKKKKKKRQVHREIGRKGERKRKKEKISFPKPNPTFKVSLALRPTPSLCGRH